MPKKDKIPKIGIIRIYKSQKPLTYLHFDEKGRLQLLEVADFLDSIRDGLGEEFIDEIEDAFEKIKSTPKTWKKVDKESEERRYGPTKKFDFVVVYELYDDGTGGVTDIYHPRKGPKD